MINEHPPKMSKLNQEMVDSTNKMNEYTSQTKVEPTLKFNKPEPKKNSVFGKVS